VAAFDKAERDDVARSQDDREKIRKGEGSCQNRLEERHLEQNKNQDGGRNHRNEQRDQLRPPRRGPWSVAPPRRPAIPRSPERELAGLSPTI